LRLTELSERHGSAVKMLAEEEWSERRGEGEGYL
jgi:hypothetical protein